MSFHRFTVNINKKIAINFGKHTIPMLYVRASLSTKVKTHYDTLGVSSNATHNEIKSAYYELSLKYHPDRNYKKSATQKFHEISDAYDVLSKFESRKKYDRTIFITKTKHVYSDKKRQEPELKETYSAKHMYNIDEWIQKHYTEALNEQRKLKQEEQLDQSTVHFNEKFSALDIVFIILFMTTIILFLSLHTKWNESKNTMVNWNSDK